MTRQKKTEKCTREIIASITQENHSIYVNGKQIPVLLLPHPSSRLRDGETGNAFANPFIKFLKRNVDIVE